VSKPLLVLVDVVAWGLIHTATGYLVHRMPAARFERDTWLTRPRAFERGGRLYVERFRIKRWKGWLPEAGDVFAGGFNKKRLTGFGPEYLATYARETRRAETGHWLAAAFVPIFFLWNPLPVGLAMVVYAIAANGPCILSQRYNRLRLARVAAGRRRLGGAPGAR
jgi:glycosyl-4,4'-diaponeurosporenoate acyltransferase